MPRIKALERIERDQKVYDEKQIKKAMRLIDEAIVILNGRLFTETAIKQANRLVIKLSNLTQDELGADASIS